MSQMEDQVLNRKPWVDAQGTVHLPIAVAMDEILKRGLPTRSGGAVPSAPVKSQAGGPDQNAPGTTSNAPAVKQ